MKDERWLLLLFLIPLLLMGFTVYCVCRDAERAEQEFLSMTPETHPVVVIEGHSARKLSRKINYLALQGYEVVNETATSNWLSGTRVYITLQAKGERNAD